MTLPAVKDFFTNKVNIQLKTGQRFEGLLNRIDYKASVVILENVEDLGNEFDPNCVPHDKKMPEKAFEADNIIQIFMKASHFSQPKKYKKEEFWDAISEPQVQKEKKYKPKYEEGKKDYRNKKTYNERDNNYRPRGDRGYERREEPRGGKEEESEDRELR